MARIISIVNQKGGVGKTTTAVNLSAYLACFGKFVLLIDCDPQGNATSAFGHNHSQLERGVYEGLMGYSAFDEVIIPTKIDGHRIAPATLDLAGVNIELVNEPEREYKLRKVLGQFRHVYDYIIIDCPPSLGLLTINALVASDEVVVPVQTEYYALEGLSQLLNTIHLVRDNLHTDLRLLGAVMTMFDERNRLSNEVFHELYRYFPDQVFRTVIPRNVSLAEAPSHGQTVLEYDPRSKGAKAYKRLAKEIISHENK